MKTKAIGLISGGLDSMVATLLMMKQGIDAVLLKFASPFFHSDIINKQTIEFMGLSARVVNMGNEYFDIIKHPQYGYGSGFNPCIDCKMHMLSIAKRVMEQEDAAFIFTGDVLNQRPFSQRKNFFHLIDKRLELEGRILRPLSAKLLEPTIPEINGIVNREELLGISGRSREQQLKIASEYNLSGYSQPSGGCLLTDKIFSKRIKDLLNNWPESTLDDAELIKHGRIFWYKKNLIVIGRNQNENRMLELLLKSGDVVVEINDIPCPVCVIRGKDITDEVIQYAKGKILEYTPKAKGKSVDYLIRMKE
jgi:tRNA U34 2-thiouridine synthase MnmA/TrmU